MLTFKDIEKINSPDTIYDVIISLQYSKHQIEFDAKAYFGCYARLQLKFQNPDGEQDSELFRAV